MPDKGFRKGKDKESIIKEMIDKGAMTQGEWNRLEKQREYNNVDVGSLSGKILLACDNIIRSVQQEKKEVEKLLEEIQHHKTIIAKTSVEITTVENGGQIKMEIKPGFPMTLDELHVFRLRSQNAAYFSSRDVVLPLGTIRSLVGTHDPSGKVVITEEEFEDYVKTTEQRLKKLGYELFEGTDR